MEPPKLPRSGIRGMSTLDVADRKNYFSEPVVTDPRRAVNL